jgi:hypothetical protein
MSIETGCKADKGYTPVKLNNQNVDDDDDDDDVKMIHLKTCRTKTLHGIFTNLLQENHMEKESSLLWLSAGCIHPEKGLPVTIQDRVNKL